MFGGKGKISFGKINLKLASEESAKDERKTDESFVVEGSFGKFGAEIPDKKLTNEEEENTPLEEENTEISQSMGFASFGKAAKTFDIEDIVKQSKEIANERNKERLEKLCITAEDDANEELDALLGKKSSSEQNIEDNSDDSDDDDDLMGPPLPPDMAGVSSDEESDEELTLPVTHELLLNHGSRTVSALASDPSGSRIVTGSIDYTVKYWDFQGMDLTKEAFRSFMPSDGYPIRSVDYSCTGDKVLVVSGSVQAKVYDRDGVEVFETVRGDMYLHDMSKTKGHVTGLTDGKWHPKNKEEFLTAGSDGTCRLWYTNRPLQQIHVLKPRGVNGLKTNPTSCDFSRDGLLVACACDDGSIQMWDHRKNFVNTVFLIRRGHQQGTDTSCITFSYDNKAFLTRGNDETLKLWDIRNNKQPINSVNDLPSRFSMTDCLFSPSDKLVVTATSDRKDDKGSKLIFYDRDSLNVVKELELENNHAAKLVWHPRLNQIILGCGNGEIKVLYDPKQSRNGALFLKGKRKKRTKQAEVVVSQQIITPHALPLFREERHKSSRKVEEKDRKDPVRSHQPDLPIGKTGSGGRVSTGGSTLSSYIIRNMGIRNKVREEGDPREALLKHAKEAQSNPYWVSPAYAKTQPTTIFQLPENEEGQRSKKQKTKEDPET